MAVRKTQTTFVLVICLYHDDLPRTETCHGTEGINDNIFVEAFCNAFAACRRASSERDHAIKIIQIRHHDRIDPQPLFLVQ